MHSIILQCFRGRANSLYSREKIKSCNDGLSLTEHTNVIQSEKEGKEKAFQVEQKSCAKAGR